MLDERVSGEVMMQVWQRNGTGTSGWTPDVEMMAQVGNALAARAWGYPREGRGDPRDQLGQCTEDCESQANGWSSCWSQEGWDWRGF